LTPKFIRPGIVLKIHEAHIANTGGSGGIRDYGLLDSALNSPAATFDGQFLHKDLFEMAAAYLFGLVKNHPFVDGNKRVGLSVTLTFLHANNYIIDSPNPLLEEMTLAVAASQMMKEELADHLRRLARPVGPSRLVDR
jgi:death on curing protein